MNKFIREIAYILLAIAGMILIYVCIWVCAILKGIA